jgi:hypothetical protein
MVAELAARDRGRTEATIQSKLHLLLTAAPLDIGEAELNEIVLESPVGDRRRIDVAVGTTVIEVKKDLRLGSTLVDATAQLAGYVEHRSQQTGTRYVGILTDGCEWYAFHLAHGELKTTRSCSTPRRAASGSVVVLAPNWSAAPPSTRRQRDASGSTSTSSPTFGPSTSMHAASVRRTRA